jgi:hypothetical protein
MSDIDPSTPAQQKAALRRAAAARRDALTGREARSTAICARILGLEQFRARHPLLPADPL